MDIVDWGYGKKRWFWGLVSWWQEQVLPEQPCDAFYHPRNGKTKAINLYAQTIFPYPQSIIFTICHGK